ncbi:hypothetical protein Ntsu_79410 [Nocardia sp. IFM 10818]
MLHAVAPARGDSDGYDYGLIFSQHGPGWVVGPYATEAAARAAADTELRRYPGRLEYALMRRTLDGEWADFQGRRAEPAWHARWSVRSHDRTEDA